MNCLLQVITKQCTTNESDSSCKYPERKQKSSFFLKINTSARRPRFVKWRFNELVAALGETFYHRLSAEIVSYSKHVGGALLVKIV